MTGRLLLPALVRLAGAGQLPAETADRRHGPRRGRRRRLPRPRPAEARRAPAGPGREGDGGPAGARCRTGRPTSPPRTPCARALDGARVAHGGLPRPAERPVPAHARGSVAGGAAAAHDARRREAVRHGPRRREGAQRSDRPVVRRARRLPHRPLPGEADRPGRSRPAFRQPHLRAGVEQRPHQPGRHHLVRVAGAGGARELLRPGRRSARHDPEPSPADARAGRDGPARGRSPSGTCATARSRRCGPWFPRSPRRWRRRPAAPATPRAPSAGRTCRPTPTPRASTRRGARRPTPR